jgi:hypothetical protein
MAATIRILVIAGTKQIFFKAELFGGLDINCRNKRTEKALD